MEKGFAKTLAYKLLASEGVVSRNVAKRLSDQWGREASAFHRKWHVELEGALDELGLLKKLKRIEHHDSHAANAYYGSGFDEALIVTLDGYGSGLAGSVAVGRGGRIERVHGVEFPHSLGTFYESVTSGLGFKPSRHEGKIVGLAAYGEPAVLAGGAAVPFSPRTRLVPDRREQQLVLCAHAGVGVPEDRRRGGVSTRPRGGGHRVRRPLPATDRHRQPGAVGRCRGERQAESAAARVARCERHLRPPQHGRWRVRHGRGDARVRRQPGIDGTPARRVSGPGLHGRSDRRCA